MPELDPITLFREFITLFVVIDPIGTLPVFYFATQRVPNHLHWKIAFRGVVVATFVLLLFLIGGQIVIEAIGLRLGSFQIAGGIILFLFALTMIFGDPKASREIEAAEKDHMSGAVFPLAMPSIASPGAMLAVVILTDNKSHSIPDQMVTGALLMVVLMITLVLLLLASQVKRVIGSTGSNVISRVMGMILAAVAVDSVVNGLEVVGMISLGG
ncbi:MarC family protein [Rhodobacteraceae bacterium D3-12]|nr:MarC family protein [Rhodobacteraceae bacterium D3-12]